MASLRNIALFVLSVSFMTFVAFFGRLPGLRNTPIGFLHRVLWIHIPRLLGRIDQTVTGGRLVSSLSRTGHYLLYEKHPIVMIFFLGLISGSAVMMLYQIWFQLSGFHHMLIAILLPLPYLFTYLCASVKCNPELYITSSNHSRQMSYYPYDYTLYHPGAGCRTCHFQKPARSKHCSICKSCISRSDHHCVWVNNCVGRGNLRWFLALLLSTSILVAYGAYLAYIVLAPQVRVYRAAVYPESQESKIVVSSTWQRITAPIVAWFWFTMRDIQIAINIGGLSVAGVGLLATFTSALPFGLLAYHVYLIWAGTTTNENSKWSDWREDMADGVVWLADLKTPEAGQDVGVPKSREWECYWPTRPRQCVVQTSDGQMPRTLPKEMERIVDASSWRRVWRLASVENVYDLGFWDNLAEMLLH
ncbi:zf-DHHC-domain-containing protein [Rhizodiscina lignyota]|uniref:Palmitoyltransferase n=1 Tax=Rhizodiscina lignyota TaxID=1504668 RepID=A0A9P4M8D0_9PEZI|nr:zf-DHHC-domain-containing protein [Rhizodiscina lignyota]